MTAKVSSEVKESSTHADIHGELDIYFITEVKEQLVQLLNDADSLVVNLSDIDSIDTSGIQVLIMLKNEAYALNKTITFEEHSQAVIEIIELFNLSAYFGDPMVLTSE